MLRKMPKLPGIDPMPVNGLAKGVDKNVGTIYRWGSPRGVRGHRLRLTRIGGRTYVFRADWEAFMAALNNGSVVMGDVAQERMPSSKIDAELDAAGF